MNLFEIILDFIFPPSKDAQKVSHTTAEDVAHTAKRASDDQGLESDDIFPIFDYKDETIRTLIWELKYKRNQKSISILGKILSDELLAILADLRTWKNFNNPILIPLPLSKERQRERGFNQTLLLAQEIKKYVENTIELKPELLSKIKHTDTQTSQSSKQERMNNLKGCFQANNSELIKNRNVILLDDVITTGATIHEARNTLLKAEAKRVIAVTVAH